MIQSAPILANVQISSITLKAARPRSKRVRDIKERTVSKNYVSAGISLPNYSEKVMRAAILSLVHVRSYASIRFSLLENGI